MNEPEPIPSVVAEASPAAKAPAVGAVATAKLELLGGDEIVELSIKPSPWFVFLVSARWLLVLTLMAAALVVALQQGWSREKSVAFQVVVGVGLLRVTIAMLQWASRLYVLTNRRVMRFTGVLNVSVSECLLARIGRADLQIAPYQRTLRLGTIQMAGNPDGPTVTWDQVAQPQAIHERLVRAIRKAQSKD